jgi:hypothetical protein
MTSQELQAAARQPFKPFRIELTTGAQDDIRHPDLIMVGQRSVAIGITGDPGAVTYELLFHIDLLHIVGIQELPAPSSSVNGPGT